MIGKLIIPVINTEAKDFSYNQKLSVDDYSNMVLDNFNRTNDDVTRFTEDLMYGTRSYAPRRNGNKGHDVEDIYTYSETEAFFQNIKGESVEIPFFEEYVENGKKAIIKVNINPNSFDPDCESEFKYWVEDCKRVISDDTIDERTKILTIPKRFFHISVGNKKYLIDGCQIVKDFSDKKYPFNYAILVEKIERICK